MMGDLQRRAGEQTRPREERKRRGRFEDHSSQLVFREEGIVSFENWRSGREAGSRAKQIVAEHSCVQYAVSRLFSSVFGFVDDFVIVFRYLCAVRQTGVFT
ncbi:hypothetical protein KCU88_g155, partial [Aureobasidium melanogenum]